MKRNLLLSAVTACAMVGIVGCGGGSSSASTESADVSGVAVDDLILNGIVEASDASGKLLEKTRTSDKDGSYQLALDYDGVVTLTVKCDDASKMLNAETNVSATCPTTMNLRSIADVAKGVAQEVHISPLSEVVVARVKAMVQENAGSLDAKTLEQARSEIGVMFGVDPIADSPVKGTYADVVQAIQNVANADKTQSVLDVTQALAEALKDGSADGEDVMGSLVEAMASENLTNNLTSNNGVYTPPSNLASMTDFEAGKAFMEALRTQTKTTTDFVDTEEAKINTALDNTLINLEYVSNTLSMLVDNIQLMTEAGETTLTKEVDGKEYTVAGSDGAYTYTIKEGDTTWVGKISLPAVLLGDSAMDEVFKSQTLTLNAEGDMPLDDATAVAQGAEDNQAFAGTITTTRTLTNTQVTITGKVTSNASDYEVKELSANVVYRENPLDINEPTFDYLKLNKLDLEGVIDGYTIDGLLTVNAYEQNNAWKAKGGAVTTTEMEAYVECESGAELQNPSLTFTAPDGTVYNGGKTWGNDSYQGFEFPAIDGDFDWEYVVNHLSIGNSTCADDTTPRFEVDYMDDEEKITNSGYLPSDTTFVGTIKSTTAELEGTIQAKWTNIPTIDLSDESTDEKLYDVSFSGKLQMPERPETLTTLSVHHYLDDKKEVMNKVTASYSYDATLINSTGTLDDKLENGVVDITSKSGLKAHISLKDAEIEPTSTLTKDGKLLGSFEYRDDAAVIKYADGSFETLF